MDSVRRCRERLGQELILPLRLGIGGKLVVIDVTRRDPDEVLADELGDLGVIKDKLSRFYAVLSAIRTRVSEIEPE